MYRRYSPQNSIPQNRENSDGHTPPPHPPAGMPKGQWDEQKKNRQSENNSHSDSGQAPHRSNSGGQAPRSHSEPVSPPRQGQSRREYSHATLNAGKQCGNLNFQPQAKRHMPPPPQKSHTKNPLLGFLPPSLYNPQTKKILGIIEAEDLLLAALILLLSENEERENSLLIYALLYVLLGDRIDLPKFGF